MYSTFLRKKLVECKKKLSAFWKMYYKMYCRGEAQNYCARPYFADFSNEWSSQISFSLRERFNMYKGYALSTV